MKLATLFGITTAIAGALATTGNSSGTSLALNASAAVATGVGPPGVGPTDIPDFPKHDGDLIDLVWVSTGIGEHCNMTAFGVEHFMVPGQCKSVDTGFATLRSRYTKGRMGVLRGSRCVLATFSDTNCTTDGTVVQELSTDDDDDESYEPDEDDEPEVTCLEPYTDEEEAASLMMACGNEIGEDWIDPFYDTTTDEETGPEGDDDQLISARSVDAVRDHVRVFPADGPNCNNALDRDSDRQVYNDCHTFAKPFFSIRAQITRGKGKSRLDGSQPCSVLVFSDEKCHKNGAEVVHLDNTHELGTCHSVSLHHKDDSTAIAGHSWKWVCGEDIARCLDNTKSATSVKAAKSTVKTVTATATQSLACSLTTEAAHSTSVINSVVTMKPVTHTITSVFTKTQLRVHTKLITSVATDVSTIHHTITKPFSTTYKVCDAVATSRS